jgi:hypothetical protein
MSSSYTLEHPETVKTDIWNQYNLSLLDTTNKTPPAYYLTRLINQTFCDALVHRSNGVIQGFHVTLQKAKLNNTGTDYTSLSSSPNYRDSEFLKITIDPGLAIIDSTLVELKETCSFTIMSEMTFNALVSDYSNFPKYLIIAAKYTGQNSLNSNGDSIVTNKLVIEPYISIYDNLDFSPTRRYINNKKLILANATTTLDGDLSINPAVNYIILGIYTFNLQNNTITNLTQFFYELDNTLNINYEKNEIEILKQNNTSTKYTVHPTSIIEEKFLTNLLKQNRVPENNNGNDGMNAIVDLYTTITPSILTLDKL